VEPGLKEVEPSTLMWFLERERGGGREGERWREGERERERKIGK